MLVSLFIQNIAVIERAELDFLSGFTALTGETGAGKSIIIDSIGAVLGERISKDLIRTGSDRALVTAMFDIENNKAVFNKLLELGIESEDSQLQIYREIRANSKNICKVNGVPVTVAMLKELGYLLVEIHGQHDSYELLSTDIHRGYLDEYAKLGKLINEYESTFDRLKKIKEDLDELNINEDEKERRSDFLKYQIEEIEEADVQIGELDALTKRRDIMRNSEKIVKSIVTAREIVSSDNDESSVVDAVGSAINALDKISDSFEEISVVTEKLRDIEYSLQDISATLRDYEESTEYSLDELEETENRISVIYKLSLKYGADEKEILDTLKKSKEELENIEMSDEKIIRLSEEFEETKLKAIKLAKTISEKRKHYGEIFSSKVVENLRYLNMPEVQFGVSLERCKLFSGGCDKVQFMVSANPGEELKPMSKIASGGELSRIMLAIKTVLSKDDGVPTMIFDEVDAGISGEAANKVGQKIKEVSNNKQVLCITHLAQIAAMADNHMLIKKHSTADKTFTSVIALNHNQRVEELARIIGGNEITETKKEMARELLLK